MFGDWEAVIGLEVHAQLLTRTKLFCGCAVEFGDPPNTHTCPVCLGLPGALPVPNEAAIRMGVMAALALGCTLEQKSIFARKNYFYPDLPKGYQISQYEVPFCHDGKLEIDTPSGKKVARIRRIHFEEDAGKNIHSDSGESIVDLNRAGTPLVEIVGEPDLRSGEEASEYLKRLREVLMALGVCDGNLEQGSFRCDANVSVRKRGTTELGTRTELKNINSFKFVGDAITVEAKRQIAAIESGQALRMQTRGYTPDKRETYALRDKEGDAGYRYFPDPDLPPLVLQEAIVSSARERLPELPEAKRARYVGLGITDAAAQVLTGHPAISSAFDAAVTRAQQTGIVDPVKVANFFQAEVLRDVTTAGLDAAMPISADQLVEILELVAESKISGKQAKDVYAKVARTERSPRELVAAEGIAVVGDTAAIEAVVRDVIAQSPKQLAQFKAGKTALLGYFVGQVMKATKGSADPALVNEILARLLAE
ncbi:MAG: Asp-tRNA(Asn)/Glu-tRNA(Gln) amidotransferase subunit GatB [Polyangiaceae bacterium]|nr:Asp-tRNA(Asn)/Glu-tRNA(Gln) amidotransferase subunit GatB [Polyangiaceae bacterium]